MTQAVTASTLATISSDPLAAAFAHLAVRKRKALVAYVTAGFPTPADSVALMRALQDAGVDVLEVGVPFSDPMADGPVIQRASQVALQQHVGVRATLDLVSQAKLRIPVVLFSYLNPLLSAGRSVLHDAAAHGVQGILVTDLPVGADPERESWLGDGPLSFVRLVAPTTPDDRMRRIGLHGRGFVYLIARLGVTGVRDDVPPDLSATIERLRRATTLPVCAGFGISTPAQARAVGAMADGIVVGSAIVQAAGVSLTSAVTLVESLRLALDLDAP